MGEELERTGLTYVPVLKVEYMNFLITYLTFELQLEGTWGMGQRKHSKFLEAETL